MRFASTLFVFVGVVGESKPTGSLQRGMAGVCTTAVQRRLQKG
jgi:hypothetical protein